MSESPENPLFLNRELSWLEFDARVLHEAFDERNPLLERVKFLAIFATNLDEFYMVRVGGLRRRAAGAPGPAGDDASGTPPAEQLAAIERRVCELVSRARRCLVELLLPALEGHGVRLVPLSELSPAEWTRVDDFFEAQLFPVLTPLAVDPGHPFPYISNLSLSLAVVLRDPETGAERFARVKVPKSLPRWVPFGRPFHYVPLEAVIGANLGALFPGMEVLRWHAFRVTRHSDLALGTTDGGADLLTSIEQRVFQRRFGEVVRVEVEDGMPPALRVLLLGELGESGGSDVPPLTERDVSEAGPLLELGDLMAIAGLDMPALRDAPFSPNVPEEVCDAGRSIFDVVRERDVLVHHPFDSFPATVERFLEEAAADDKVLAIKLTLYRTSGDTAIVRALTEAARRGKQVAVLVELQARFDETNNITWTRTLENVGVHVGHGPPGLKTHTKIALVVRREADGVRRYAHIGTGNYNGKTARVYTDIGLFTCRPAIGADLTDLFNSLTGHSRQRHYRRLLVAPANMRQRFLALVEREADHARAGRPARIVAKMNALVDPEAIAALYGASRAGVEIDLVVRGICCLRPGVPGASDRIRVISVIGRFLEHSRVFHFANGGDEEFYIGSADWMPRNFDRRVETVTPVEDRALHDRLRCLLATYLADDRQAWELAPDGSYLQRTPGAGPDRASHVVLLDESWGRERADDSLPSPAPARAGRGRAGD
jgi:polyphosphate kinase